MAGERSGDRRLLWETIFVLAVSLGQSAWYSILRMIERLTRGVPMDQQTSKLNSSVTPGRPWLDLLYQLSDIVFGVAPALLAVLLLAQVKPPRDGVRQTLGLHGPGWGRDVGAGAILAAIIGIPGLGFYLAARAWGLNTTVQASQLQHVWWTVPVLIGLAVMNAVLEETVMVGYLFTRWRQIGWSTATVIVTSAVIRGTYHLYQGWGGFVGNIVMGLFLGWVFSKRSRLLPLVVAHSLLDIVSFIGYAYLAGHVSWL
ncbi:CPBP family intramembrane metalloprotease [Cutibacterium equinum]|uniref:CPBP family intramembrane metalloprotease n=2 Tax=Cutibacterium equinum TaxID=3016342 RepID=A0ABY7R124_9ACTN|nr:CPBP family intramembrane glutamic endopeptidase [Cutibacterium equinum]WCC80977.1 CPBP family intramembrane metalloprotease [Cutibacterium equinum]